MSPAVRLCGVSHHHAGSPAPVLASIELEVECGAVLALIGPSGAGKSTLLGLIGGQIRGWKGTAQVLGSPLSAQVAPTRDRRVDTGFIYQEFALIERATVRQNVLNGRLGRTGRYASLFGRFSIVDQAAADAALREAGIAELAEKRADRISGGQRQRVSIARCLAQEPRLILADEPVSSLDPLRAGAILELITGRAADAMTTVIFSSHQPDLALQFASRVIGLKAGRIVLDAAANAVTGTQIDMLYREERGPRDLRQAG